MARQEARPRFRDLVGTIFLILLVMGLGGSGTLVGDYQPL
jgi:hypothetical protein